MSLKSYFTEFSKFLASYNAETYTKGEAAASKIVEFLRKKRNDVSRHVIAGCLGLGANLTANGHTSLPIDNTTLPDFDLIIFFKNQNPPFHQVLIELAEAFAKNLDINIVNSSHSQYIGIVISGLKFHVFPAVDLIPESAVQNGLEIPSMQQNKTIETIQQSPNVISAGRIYSYSLSESAVKFIAEQSDFTHSIIQLAKFWIRQVHLDEELHIHGSSYLIECLAVYISSKTTKNDILDALTHFLALVTNFSKVRIIFPNTEVPDCFKSYDGPMVLDPVNPYNNLAIFRSDSALQEEIVSCIQTAGMYTLWKLEAIKNGNIRVSSMADISNLFAQKRLQSVRSQTRERTHPAGDRRPLTLLMWFLVILITPFVLLRSCCRYLARRMDLAAVLLMILFASFSYFYRQ